MEATNKLTIAVQRSGEGCSDSLELLNACGIEINGAGELSSEALNFPIKVLFLLQDDIPEYVSDGVADLGIAGEDMVFEKAREVDLVERLGFGKCRLSITIPKDREFRDIADLNGLRIATSYPKILHRYFQKFNIKAEVHEISGSAEIASAMGLADAICNLISSGGNLSTKGLKEADVVMRSEAVLIAGKSLEPWKKEILNQLLFRILAVKKARSSKYILLNVPNGNLEKIKALLPGIKSPVVLPLAEEGWSSLQAAVNENDFWKIIYDLKANGAKEIIQLPIEKMID